MSATTTYGVDLELSLGIGRQEDAGVWDTSAWNDAVWSNSDTALGNWVDVTCDVPGEFLLTAGSSDVDGVVTRWESATTAFHLSGPDWDPWGGPWAGILGPQVDVRWRWRQTGTTDWLPLFLGATTDTGFSWDPRTGTAAVVASDNTSDLAWFDRVAGAAVGANETATARVKRILDSARWPAAQRALSPVAQGVPVVATLLGGKALDELLEVADTDLATMYVDRAGRFVYTSQGRAHAGVPVGALVACPDPRYPDGVQVVDMDGSQATAVVNIAQVRPGTPPGGQEAAYVTVEDDASIARFRAHSGRYDLVHADAAVPTWSHTVAQAVVLARGWPSTAPRRVALGTVSGDPRVPGVLFTLEPGQAFDLVDTGARVWLSQVTGWDVTVSHTSCSGVLWLGDVTVWTGSLWDNAQWDTARWGL